MRSARAGETVPHLVQEPIDLFFLAFDQEIPLDFNDLEDVRPYAKRKRGNAQTIVGASLLLNAGTGCLRSVNLFQDRVTEALAGISLLRRRVCLYDAIFPR